MVYPWCAREISLVLHTYINGLPFMHICSPLVCHWIPMVYHCFITDAESGLYFGGTCAAGCPRGVPEKQAGSSPIVTPARRGWGRDSCPRSSQPGLVRARRTPPLSGPFGVARWGPPGEGVAGTKVLGWCCSHCPRPAAVVGVVSRWPSPARWLLAGHRGVGWAALLSGFVAILIPRGPFMHGNSPHAR